MMLSYQVVQLTFMMGLLSNLVFALPGPLKVATMFTRLYDEIGHIKLSECSISGSVLPLNDTKDRLPSPSHGLNLKYIAIGRGTQNYSCPTSTSLKSEIVIKPTAVGAAATLFDASCVASQSLALLHELPPLVGGASVESLGLLAETLGLTTNSTNLILGEHYFNAAGDPVFDLRLGGSDDFAVTAKNASADAPEPKEGPKGKPCLKNEAEAEDVAWLKLNKKSGNGIQEVYRVVTYEGSPPSSCAGQNATVLVQYAAEYWFYG